MEHHTLLSAFDVHVVVSIFHCTSGIVLHFDCKLYLWCAIVGVVYLQCDCIRSIWWCIEEFSSHVTLLQYRYSTTTWSLCVVSVYWGYVVCVWAGSYSQPMFNRCFSAFAIVHFAVGCVCDVRLCCEYRCIKWPSQSVTEGGCSYTSTTDKASSKWELFCTTAVSVFPELIWASGQWGLNSRFTGVRAISALFFLSL